MKPFFSVGVRLAISISVLVLIFSKLDLKKFSEIFKTVDLFWLAAGVLIWGCVPLLAGVRWRLLLQAQSIHLSYKKVLDLFFVGHFFNAFLLGTTGGDLVKIYYATQAAPDRKEAAALTIVLDRIIGLIAILLMALILIPLQWSFLTQTPQTHAAAASVLMVVVGMVIGIFFLLFFLPFLQKWEWLVPMVQKLPFKPQRQQAFQALLLFRESWKTNLKTLWISFAIHALLFGSAIAVLKSLGLNVDWLPFISTLPIIGVLMSIPISISGFGIREGLFVIYLGLSPLLISQEHAITFSLLYFCMSLFWSLFGGLFYLKYSSDRK